MREYPSTGQFPRHPNKLSRSELETVYLDLRQNYKGLSVSRGQFAAKAKRLQTEIENQDQRLQDLVKQLAQAALEQQELQTILGQLEVVSQRQRQLVTDMRQEFEFVRDDRGNLIEKFNRIMRAVYKFLNPDRPIVPAPPTEEPDESWTKEDPASINRQLLDDK